MSQKGSTVVETRLYSKQITASTRDTLGMIITTFHEIRNSVLNM